jgi:hypothetical protein
VTIPAQDPGEQPDFELLVDADLPEGWRLPERSPLDPEGESGGIDRALHYEDWIDNAPGLDRKLRSEHGNLDEGRWFLIQHTEMGIRVLLRMQSQVRVYQDRMGEVRITGVVHLPFFAGDPITSQLLRELPTAKIEAAINKRLFAVTGATRFQDGKITLPSGRTLSSVDVIAPIGDPKRTSDFYELVALQHARLAEDGDPNPTATMARLSEVALSTAQGWVAKARVRGLLPPGRRGRAG